MISFGFLALSILMGASENDIFTSHVAIRSQVAVNHESLAKIPLLSRLQARETLLFLTPLTQKLNQARNKPHERLQAVLSQTTCGAPGNASAVTIAVDFERYLSELVSLEPKSRRLKIYSALGLGELSYLTLCLEPVQGDLKITAQMGFKHIKGLLGSLRPSPLLMKQLPAFFYWYTHHAFDPEPFWQSVRKLEMALYGRRRSQIDTLLELLSSLTQIDAEEALLKPMTGQLQSGIVLSSDAKGAQPARMLRFESRYTQGVAQIMTQIAEFAPPETATRKLLKGEWAFNLGLSQLMASLPIFIRVEPHSVVMGSGQAALDMKMVTPGASMSKHFLSQTVQPVAAGVLDGKRFYGLFRRVGRRSDLEQWVQELSIQSWVNLRALPLPENLWVGFDKMAWTLHRENQVFTLRMTVTSTKNP